MKKKTRSYNRKKAAGVSGGVKGIKLAWTEITAMIMVIFCLGFILGRISVGDLSYNGPGKAGEVPLSKYDTGSFYYSDDGRAHYDDDSYTSEQVIDVSYVQKEIDWERVKADGIDHAMIRLGFRGYETGELRLDAYFEDNVGGAKAAGVEAGVYFFSQAVSVDEALEEARFVVKNLKGKRLKGPVAFDMEPIEGADRISHLTTEERTVIADAFLSYVKKKGYEPLLYGNPAWLGSNLDRKLLTDYDVWLAHYTDYTNYPYDFTMWQYTSTGRVAGVTGDVDLNIRMVKN